MGNGPARKERKMKDFIKTDAFKALIGCTVSMPYTGGTSFLLHFPESQYLCGFQAHFFRAFFRIF